MLLSNAVARKNNDVNLMRRYAEYLSNEDPLLAISEFEKISNLDADIQTSHTCWLSYTYHRVMKIQPKLY